MKSEKCKVQSEERRGLVSVTSESARPRRLHTLHFALGTSHFALPLPKTKSPLTLALSPPVFVWKTGRGEGTRAEATP